jgi:hypothetical protein
MLRVNGEDELRRRTDEFAAKFKAREAQIKANGGDMHELTEQERLGLRD